MAVLFSAVTVTAGDQEKEFLVRGIPRELGDIEGYTAFEEFMEDIDEETEVSVHAEAYLYGEGEVVNATHAELCYFLDRIRLNPNFLESRCQSAGSSDFSFDWSPDELFGHQFTS